MLYATIKKKMYILFEINFYLFNLISSIENDLFENITKVEVLVSIIL